MNYQHFIESKKVEAPKMGFSPTIDFHESLLPHQRDIIAWAAEGGRRGVFASFGLGKTRIQLWLVWMCLQSILDDPDYGNALIVCPLGVKQEFIDEAAALGLTVGYVRNRAEAEAEDAPQIMMTNYERVRDGDLGAAIEDGLFDVVSLDEASCLRSLGSKTYLEFSRIFKNVQYRFVATATPSPNDYIELLNYAAFLGIMDVSQAKTRFFQRNSEKADQLTILPHKEAEFWTWVASWAVFVTKPSDLGHSDAGYDLPELDVRWHCVPSATVPKAELAEQMALFSDAAEGLAAAAREKKASIGSRLGEAIKIMGENPSDHYLLWHHLEAERKAIEASVPAAFTVYGSQTAEEKEAKLADFAHGRSQILATKPDIAGQGCNFQKHCHRAIFLGIDYKFNDFIQAIHRIQRFQQPERCVVDIIYTEAEEGIRKALLEKWKMHRELLANMRAIITRYGLAGLHKAAAMTRTMSVDREEVRGHGWTAYHNDCVEEVAAMPDETAHLIVTSVPFSTQYEYSANYRDFGHNVDNAAFFRQMDYLVPQLLRVTKPGRICAVHVKDRIIPANYSGLGVPTLYPFSDEVRACFQAHGWLFMSRITVVTDVVRENAQTYRLGYTEMCKDGTKMGNGVPEYILVFRRAQTDQTKGYADLRVSREKDTYARAQWQLDAHAFWRSSGDRLLSPSELAALPLENAMKAHKAESLTQVYDYGRHVEVTQALEDAGKLPTSFMATDPQSWHPDVWADVVRMRGMNTMQGQRQQEQHLCPLPFDIVDRLINRYSMPGETVLDPFGGLMTVPNRAVQLGRCGIGIELNRDYFDAGVGYLCELDDQKRQISFFDILDGKEGAA